MASDHGVGRPPVDPALTLRPGSVDGAAAGVARARRAGLAVAVSGAGSRRHWLPGPAAPYAWLRLDQVSDVLEVNPDNLTGAFLAGTPVGAVQAELAEYGLFWPVDAAPERTVGAVVAAGAGYPGRTGYGPVRDWVLGLTVLTDTGDLMSLGAPTMKNVAGYDLVRLHTGARGTLGPILAVILRLLPRQERQVTLVAPAPRDGAPPGELRDLLAACEWLMEPGTGARFLLRVDGRQPAAARRVTDVQTWLPGSRVLAPAEAEAAWAEARGAHARAAAALGPDWVRLRLAVPAASAWAVAATLDQFLGAGQWRAAGPLLLGLVTVWTTAPPAVLGGLQARFRDLGGDLRVQGAPAAVLAQLPLHPAHPVDRALREALAPAGCFNPHL